MNDKIKDIQGNVKDAANKIWLAGLGAFAMAEEEGSKLFTTLIEKGENFETKATAPVDKMKDSVKDKMDDAKDRVAGVKDMVEEKVQAAIDAALAKAGIPSKDEIKTLIDRVEQLAAKVDELNK